MEVMSMATNDLMMTREQAAKYLGVSVSFLAADAVTRRHGVPFYKIGSRVVYSQVKVDAWLAARAIAGNASN